LAPDTLSALLQQRRFPTTSFDTLEVMLSSGEKAVRQMQMDRIPPSASKRAAQQAPR
jgi:hypothetical protein